MAISTSTFNNQNVDYNDPKVWSLICEGKTKGVFQLESQLGKSWAKRVRPNNIEELAALISLIRPGCLKAIIDGKSMTQHYVDRKMGIEEIEYIHDSLEDTLSSTYGVLVYQEQSMKIAQTIAGFDLQEADDLRKAIGKKKAGLMAKIKKKFIKGAKRESIVDPETAEEIFSWIEKSSRYAFNKSHAVSYAICGYWSAYCKTHFPIHFFCSYLYHSIGKQDQQQEIKELISDAKTNNINVLPPQIDNIKPSFNIKHNNIYYGIRDVKYVGQREVEKILNVIDGLEEEHNKNISDFTWYEFLINAADKINKKAVIALISIGAISSKKEVKSRNSMLYEFDTWNSLTLSEKKWIRENSKTFEVEVSSPFPSLVNSLKFLAPTKKQGGGTHNYKRSEIVKDMISLLESPPYSLEDTPEWIANEEEKYLGVSITYSRIDSCDTSAVNTTCREIEDGKKGKSTIAIQVCSVREWTIKKGKNKGNVMAFVSGEDNTGLLDSIIVFSDQWEKHKDLFYEGNTLLIVGKVSEKDSSLIVEKVLQI